MDRPRLSVTDPALLETYHQLAGLIPQGIAALARRAEHVLPGVLDVEWVRIQLPMEFDSFESHMESTPDVSHGQTIPLSGSFAPLGHMVLGPCRHADGSIDHTRAVFVAAFLTTLLELAHRDQCLKRLAIIDELTGAYNRRYLEYFLRQIIDQSRQENTQVTLLLFDIDNFKHYNDTYGHAAGDDILREATRLMKLCCRKHDIVSRMGGDEFAVLFWDTGLPRQVYANSSDSGENTGWARPGDSVRQEPSGPIARAHHEATLFISNRFRRILRTTHFPSLGPEARGTLTVSGGLAGFPTDGTTVEQLLAKADDALLASKRQGKNRITLVGRPDES